MLLWTFFRARYVVALVLWVLGETFSMSGLCLLSSSTLPLPGPLAELYLWGNSLTGPAQFASLPGGLRMLQLDQNKLTALPTSLPDSLVEVTFHRNRLSGTLSADSLRLPATLTSLRLDGNSLTGSLPAWSSFPSGLKRLDLDGNSFTGSIPPGWSSMPDGITVALMTNELTGAPFIFLSLYQLQGLVAAIVCTLSRM